MFMEKEEACYPAVKVLEALVFSNQFVLKCGNEEIPWQSRSQGSMLSLTANGPGSIPSQGTKNPQAAQCGQNNFFNKNKKHKTCT